MWEKKERKYLCTNRIRWWFSCKGWICGRNPDGPMNLKESPEQKKKKFEGKNIYNVLELMHDILCKIKNIYIREIKIKCI